MQYEADTPEVYLSQLENDWRKDKLFELRQKIFDAAPDISEHIHYKMLGYGIEGRWLCHLNAQKHYVSLYLGDLKALDPDGSLLDGLNMGKGCLRISKTINLADTGIEELLCRAVARWRRGEQSGC